MAWGGARPNSGPKKKGGVKGSSPKAATATIPASPATARPMFTGDAIEALLRAVQERQIASRTRPRTEAWNPYIIHRDRFGPVDAHVQKNRRRLAMDSNQDLMASNQIAIQAWQAGGLLGNAVSEGLLFLGYPYLSELAQRPEFRLFGEIRAEEMTRKWTQHRGTDDESMKEEDKPAQRNKDDEDADASRKKTGAKPRTDSKNKEIEAKIKEMKDLEDELKVRDWFKAAAAQDSFFGISHLFVETKGVDINNQRDPELRSDLGNGRDGATQSKLKGVKGFLKGLRTIEPIWCYPTTYNAQNPLVPSWYDPVVWYVMGTEIHKSRLLSFIGRPVPDILKPAYAFGGLSMTQMGQPYVDIWLRTRESVGEIIHAFSVMVLKTDLATTTMPGGSGGGAGDVLARLALFLMLRDNQGVFAIDKNKEDFANVSAPLSGLDELQAQAQEHMMCCQVGTLVETDRGQVPIEKVTLNDRVMTRSGLAPLSWVGQTGMASKLVEIRTSDAILRATEWHPIWSETSREFVSAENVGLSHRLLRSTNWGNRSTAPRLAKAPSGIPVEIVSVNVLEGVSEPVYNLEVAAGFLPEFYANGILVHNSVARIPAVKFTGIQPKGLNATSEGEMRAFNDTIHGSQEHLYRAHLTTIYDLMQYHLWGARDPDITFEFLPLQELTPKEKAEVRKLESERTQILIDSGQVSQEEARTALVNDPESGFHGLDPEDVPELLEEENEGLEPEGGRPQPQAEVGEKEQGKDGGIQNFDDAPSPEEARRQAIVTAGGDRARQKKKNRK